MRLWSIHPRYLDAKGLIAWRKALGYRHHPQFRRFRPQTRPAAAINEYLRGLFIETSRRGYSFDARKLGCARFPRITRVTWGQMRSEAMHLRRKLKTRERRHLKLLKHFRKPVAHPLFRIRRGPIEDWVII